MNKVKIYAVVSIDGFISSPDGGMDWVLEADIPRDVDFGIHAFYEGIGIVAMTLSHYLSLHSCELLGPHMEKPCLIVRSRDDIGITSNHEVEYVTDPGNGFPNTIKYIRDLKTCGGRGDIWVAGDNRLITALFDAGVIDEVIITMIPVSLGKGIRLFPADFNEKKWASTRVFHYDYGVTQIHYRSRETENDDLPC